MVKLAYYFSYALSAPFYLASWTLYIPSYILSFVGDYIHDATTYKLWLKIYKDSLKK